MASSQMTSYAFWRHPLPLPCQFSIFEDLEGGGLTALKSNKRRNGNNPRVYIYIYIYIRLSTWRREYRRYEVEGMSSWDKHPLKITPLALPLSLLQEKEAKEINAYRASRDKMSAAHYMFPYTKYCPEFIAKSLAIYHGQNGRGHSCRTRSTWPTYGNGEGWPWLWNEKGRLTLAHFQWLKFLANFIVMILF